MSIFNFFLFSLLLCPWCLCVSLDTTTIQNSSWSIFHHNGLLHLNSVDTVLRHYVRQAMYNLMIKSISASPSFIDLISSSMLKKRFTAFAFTILWVRNVRTDFSPAIFLSSKSYMSVVKYFSPREEICYREHNVLGIFQNDNISFQLAWSMNGFFLDLCHEKLEKGSRSKTYKRM